MTGDWAKEWVQKYLEKEEKRKVGGDSVTENRLERTNVVDIMRLY